MKSLSDLISAVKARQAEIAVSLARGTAGDFAAYQRLVGEYTGLETTLTIIDNLLREDDDYE
ncbi:MAG: hypothetical protein EBR82_32890 [Caulobacteraceae bacterium]|jgi:hypothetical protein|nr:hypothetical protein [Caulobacteraceae bacterium]NDD14915.1 hypothetical protein [Betaproteobacteria bacterium]